MPLSLVQGGCCARTNAGDPTCFGYNFGTYDLPVNRGRCDKEFHVCVCVCVCGPEVWHAPSLFTVPCKEGCWFLTGALQSRNPTLRSRKERKDATIQILFVIHLLQRCDYGGRRNAAAVTWLVFHFSGDAHLFVEACCGWALLSNCVAKIGFEAMR